jgi:hypothetical protein
VDENGIGAAVIGCAIRVHMALGPGLLENAYETCLDHEITKAGGLLNFNVSRMKDGVNRMVNGL